MLTAVIALAVAVAVLAFVVLGLLGRAFALEDELRNVAAQILAAAEGDAGKVAYGPGGERVLPARPSDG